MSMGAWAGICDGPSADKPDYKEYCEKQNSSPVKLQTTLESTKEISKNEKGVCFGPRGQDRQYEEYCSKQEGWTKEPPYVGDYLDGKRHGQGILRHSYEDSKYVGDFRDGNKHGYGTLYYENGNIYQGAYVNNNKHGIGLCKFSKQPIREKKERIGERSFNKYYKETQSGSGIFECAYEHNNAITLNSGGTWLSNFAGELLGAAIEGAIEGAILGSFSEPCVPEVKVRASQTIPGAPQYGTKTRTTIKPCATPYKLK